MGHHKHPSKPPTRDEPGTAVRAAQAAQHVVSLVQRGNLAEAERICLAILAAVPGHFQGQHLLGVIAARQGRLHEARRLLAAAIVANPQSAEALTDYAMVLTATGAPQEALSACARAVGLKPDFAFAHHAHGKALIQLGRYSAALDAFQRALSLAPDLAPALLECGHALAALGRHGEALRSFDAALLRQPKLAEALNSRGAALSALERHGEALRSYDEALAIQPSFLWAQVNRANALKELGRHEESLASFDRALELNPRSPEAAYNRGLVLTALRRHGEALASYERALQLRPAFVEALHNRAAALSALQRRPEAIAAYGRVLGLRPGFHEARYNRGVALALIGKHEEAIRDLEGVREAGVDLPYLSGMLLRSRMHTCDWSTYAADRRQLTRDVRAGKRVVEPFIFLGLSDDPADQLQCARTWVADQSPGTATTLWNGERYRHDRIRVAYVSSDFREHPLGHLMAGLFERHDRSHFEISALSTGPSDGSAMRQRLEKAFDQFLDVHAYDDFQVARLVRDMEIDILVDRNGFTTGARTAILAQRPAPLQVSYLAYPGTMGADYIDYLIADEVVIPRSERASYSEQIVYLPDCYQVNDCRRTVPPNAPSRHDVGLPDQAFVFCCFNNTYKVTPDVFDIWMQLLREVDNGVLWLLEGNGSAMRNLRRAAVDRGVKAERVVFAGAQAQSSHLARHRLADLFLDTQPYNAHTAASDALLAGLPVLTCTGTTFAGRVATSMLKATGLPELITSNAGEYASRAIELATDPSMLMDIRNRLASNLRTWPLFDTDRSRRHIEAAYTEMWKRHQQGLPPLAFGVTAG